ncbi:tetratricopeptide repeat protein [Saccharothrix deserti]|uniref:tetratricopeptide repeat protein n=1 Tax=Saccharothrix deserti TaxID=2593674 RepID=UPI00131EAAFF|nr:tetratricopeptide repeat protein [Saccharothrix deserti]
MLVARHRDAEAMAAFVGDDDRLVACRVTELSRAHEYDRAVAVATDALAKSPDSVPLRLALGRTHLDAWRPGAALAVFEEARRLAGPDDPRAIRARISRLRAARRFEEAEETARQALINAPDEAALHVLLAEVYDHVRAFDRAERQFAAAREIDPYHGSHADLGALYVQMGRYEEAYAQAQSAIESAPDTEADPHFVAGVAHHRMGSLAADARGRFGYRVRAMHHLRECLTRSRGHVDAQRNLQLLEREMKAVAPASGAATRWRRSRCCCSARCGRRSSSPRR